MVKPKIKEIDTPLLSVHETFQETIQGEGYWSGTPCDFIRLAGCPVGCPWCDTGYSSDNINKPTGVKRTIEGLIEELKSNFVVISGGEPFANPHLQALTARLIKEKRRVGIETSGSFYQDIEGAWVTLSPKEHINKRFPVKKEMWSLANEVKLVISTGEEILFYRDKLNGLSVPIYLQPEWENRKETIPLTIELVIKYKYRLSLQSHKFIGVR